MATLFDALSDPAGLGSDMQQSLIDAYVRADIPASVHLDVTYRCDLNCGHCYLDNRETWPEMATAEWLKVLDQLKQMGTLYLVWSGGEVFKRPDFEALVARAGELGFLSRIKTHAGNLDSERAKSLAKSRVTRIDVSVYSLRPEIHEGLTRIEGSLGRTLAGIDAAIAAGIRVRVNVFLLKDAIEEIPSIHNELTARGCEVRFTDQVIRDHSASDALDHLWLSDSDRRRAGALVMQVMGGVSTPERIDPKRGACGAGRHSAYVSPDGGLWPCVNFPMELGNLRSASFSDIWRSSAERKALVEWKNSDRGGCLSCAGSGFCFFCPGDAYKSTGDFRKAPANFHAVTRARMLAFEDIGGAPFDAEAWASVPGGDVRPKPPKRFEFPIYRARKGQGARVR